MTENLTKSWETLVHALALASRLEDAGQYNLAKLLRASVDALTRQAAYRYVLPEGRAALAGETMRTISFLNALQMDGQLIASIQRGASCLAEGRLPHIYETPDPYVCRSCGSVSILMPVEPCPECGAQPETFQRHIPVYWLNALNPFNVLEKLRQTPPDVAALLYEMPEDVLRRRPEDGGWSIRNIIAHLLDAQRVFNFRVNLMLDHEYPELKSLAVYDWALNEEERSASTGETLTAYRESRLETLSRLESISLADWWLQGQHQEFGSVTILQQASYFAMHEISHLSTIERMRSQAMDAQKPAI